MQETGVWSLGQEYPLEKGMAIHSSILAWRIPWIEEPDGLQSVGSQRVVHNRSDWARKYGTFKWVSQNSEPNCTNSERWHYEGMLNQSRPGSRGRSHLWLQSQQHSIRMKGLHEMYPQSCWFCSRPFYLMLPPLPPGGTAAATSSSRRMFWCRFSLLTIKNH